MVCIARSPRCSGADSPAVPEPLTDIAAALALIAALVAAIIGTAAGLGAVSVVNGVLTIGGVSIGAAAGLGLLGGGLGAIVAGIVIALNWFERCRDQLGPPTCVSGVVVDLVDSFSSTWDDIFPFTAQHDRVDVVAKSSFWDMIESGDARVFCTSEPSPRRSEIMRCYFYEPRVCAAARGALASTLVGVPAGIAAGVAIALAIGCATVIFCLLALLAALIVAALAVLAVAWAGGQIGKALSDQSTPSAGTGETLVLGTLITVGGGLIQRGDDGDANVIYWASGAQFHGYSLSPQPFSYCEIDDEFTDGCGTAPIIL